MAALQFGYLSYLRESDPVDPGVSEYLGAGCQSVFISHEHQAVIVSMGDFGFLCEPIWTKALSWPAFNDIDVSSHFGRLNSVKFS